jgi:hypothetical protein
MKAAFRARRKDQRDAVTKLGKSKVGTDGITIDAVIIRFVDAKSLQERDVFKGSETQVEVLPVNLDRVPDKPGVIRTNKETGAKEVNCRVTTDEGSKKYIRYYAADALDGTYSGNFSPLLTYWDAEKECVPPSVWTPLQDALGKKPLLLLKVWRGDTPEDMIPGSIISISVKFEQYISIPKAKGFAKAAENQERERAQIQQHVQAPTDMDNIPDEVLAAAAAAAEEEYKPKRSPQIRFSISTNSGIQFSENNVICTPLQSLSGLVADRQHFVFLPEWDGDSYAMVVPLSGYQDDCDTYDMCEPGPSTIRMPLFSIKAEDYEKVPRGADLQSTMRESKKTITMMVMQYDGEKPDSEVDLPFTLEFTVYTEHVHRLGITWHSSWLKFGRIPWQGVAVCTVNAPDTRRLRINQAGAAADAKQAGKVDCWIKTIYWDIPGTVKREGVPVTTKLIAKLYADLYKHIKTDEEDTILLRLDSLKDRTQFPNRLHEFGDNSVINLNEWKSEAGWIFDQYDLWVLPYFPVPVDMMINGETDTIAVQDYLASGLEKLRELDEDQLVKVLLGEELLDGIQTYHPEEVKALKAIGTQKDRALAYPGRGPSHKRVYKGRKDQNPSSYGFDFLVYAIKRDPAEEGEEEEEEEEPEVEAEPEPEPEPKPKKPTKTQVHPKTRPGGVTKKK